MNIFKDSMNNHFVENVKYPAVTAGTDQTFADVVRRVRNEKGFSLADVERNSGGEIDSSYVSRIENGYILPQRMTAKKLVALADGLQVPAAYLAEVASGELHKFNEGQKGEKKLINYFRELPLETQLDVLAITEAIWCRRQVDRNNKVPVTSVTTKGSKRGGKKQS
jgi:transcriptional regulator with XRE-family HTH domain